MPTYRYRCAKCGDELEEWQSFSDAPLTRHGECGGKLAKVFSTPGIVLKGSGFYRTDSRNGSSKRSTKKSDDGGSEKSEQTEKKDVKADAKADPSSSETSSSPSSGSNGDGGTANPAKKGDAATAS